MFKQNVTGHKSRTMKPHTYAGYLFPLEEELAKKKQFYIYGQSKPDSSSMCAQRLNPLTRSIIT